MEAIIPIAVATSLILGALIAFTFFSNYFRQHNKKPQSRAPHHHHHSRADKIITWRSLKRIRSRKRKTGHDCLTPTFLFKRQEVHYLFQSSDFPSGKLNSNEVPMEEIFRKIRSLVSYAYFYDYKKDGHERIGAFSSLTSLADLLKLVELSHGDDRRAVMLDALRALTIILSSTTRDHFVASAVRYGVIGLLLPISEFPTSFTKEVVLSLGNICAASSHYRDIVLRKGGMMDLLTLLDATDIGMNRIVTWAISNICHGKPQPLFEEIKVCLPVLRNFLEVSTDLEVLSNVCWTLSFMSNTSKENIDFIVQSGISNYLLQINEPCLIFPTLLAVGNILTGNDSECHILLELGVLPWLQTVARIGLKKKQTSLCSSVCWAISNIACRGGNYVQRVVNGGFVETLINVLASNPRSKVMRHATRALSYVADAACDSASRSYSNRLFFDLLPLLNSTYPRLLLVCLKLLRNLAGEEHPAVGGEAYNNILKLLTDNDPEIRAVAKELVILVGRA